MLSTIIVMKETLTSKTFTTFEKENLITLLLEQSAVITQLTKEI